MRLRRYQRCRKHGTAERTAKELSTKLDQSRTQFAKCQDWRMNLLASKSNGKPKLNYSGTGPWHFSSRSGRLERSALSNSCRGTWHEKSKLKAHLLEGRRELHGVSEQLVEPLEVIRADATLVKVKKGDSWSSQSASTSHQWF